MKSFRENDDNNHSNTTNLLGFSHSSNMLKMGESLFSSSSAATSSVPPQLVICENSSNYGVCHGSNSAGEIYSHMSLMPLRSDGSLCLMEALNRSFHSNHRQDSSPEMGDFFGTHQNNISHKEAIDIRLDSLFYKPSHEPNNNPNFEEFFSFPHTRNHHEEETRNYENDPGLTHRGDNVGVYGEFQESLSLSMSPSSQSSCITGSHHNQNNQSQNHNQNHLSQNKNNHQISEALIETSVGIETTAMAAAKKKRRQAEVEVVGQKQIVHRKSTDTFRQRTSQYRGVSRFFLLFK